MGGSLGFFANVLFSIVSGLLFLPVAVFALIRFCLIPVLIFGLVVLVAGVYSLMIIDLIF